MATARKVVLSLPLHVQALVIMDLAPFLAAMQSISAASGVDAANHWLGACHIPQTVTRHF